MSPVIFETMRVRDGRLPLLAAHLARLARSAELLTLPAPPPGLAAEAEARAERGKDRILRLAWHAAGAAWSERPLDQPAVWRVRTVDEPHPGYPVKTEDRGAFDRALAAARAAHADEPLLATSTGTVVEGARFAVVWEQDGAICYPDPGLGGLPSIGLGRLLTVAADAGMETRAAWQPVSELAGRPLGLVNAVRGLVHARFLDGHRMPAGERLETLAARFWPA